MSSYRSSDWIIAFARIIIGLSFVGSALGAVAHWDYVLTDLRDSPFIHTLGKGMLPSVMIARIVLEIVGGVLVTLGFWTRFGSLCLVFVMGCTVLFMRPLANLTDASFITAYFAFLMDAKTLGAVLYIMVFGPGRMAIDKG